MPLPPPRRCVAPGCAEVVMPPQVLCPRHGGTVRTSARRRGYTHRWEGVRRAFLSVHPACEDCGARATDVDHRPARAILLARGVPDPDDPRYLHALCHSCHSRRTAYDALGYAP